MKVIKYCVVCGKSNNTRSPKYCSTACANKDYYLRHQKDLRKAHIEWQNNNKDKSNEIQANWRKNNMEHYKEYQANYRKKRKEMKNDIKEVV